MKPGEKKIGPNEIRPDKVSDESLLVQLARAVAAGERDQAFDLAKIVVGAVGRPSVEDDGLLPLSRVAQKLGVSTRTVWRLVSSGEMAAPVHVRGARRWRPDDVDQYLSDISAGRRKAVRTRGR